MPDNILITGGAGFIGSRLAQVLASRGHRITVLDSLSEQIHGPDPKSSYLFNSLPTNTAFIHGDVSDSSIWTDALAQQTVVVHLAAETGTGQSMYQIEKYCRANVGGTAALLEALVNCQHSVRKIVVASSRAIYGEGKYFCQNDAEVYPDSRDEEAMAEGDFSVKCPKCRRPVEPKATDEDAALKPGSVYGITKLTQEQMISVVGRAIGVATTSLRYQNVFGPGQSLQNPYTGILSIFTSAIFDRGPINIFEDGTPSRDFVYIDDVVDATVKAIEMTEADNQDFNVGSGIPVDLMTVVSSLEALHGKKANANTTGNFRSGDIRHNYADLTRISGLLGYKPVWNFQSGLKEFVSWSQTQSVGHGYLDSLAEIRKKGLLK